eukprot:m.307177 g.307177  ORF g.307177 m.307177 type:complete len:342 (+) comp16359_c0_seq2:2467-3492(+)
MTAIQIKHNRVVALCGGALLLYAGFRHHIRAPNPLLESGHHVPSSVRDLRLTEMMLIPAVQSTVTPDMPSTVFVARQARFIVDKSKLNRPQPPPPNVTWQKCVSGSDAGLCVVAHLLLTWADSNMRALGCAIGIATSVERSNLAIVRRFKEFGWCHQDPCSQSSHWWCKAPILGTEECSLIANAAESFTGVTPQLEDLQESLSDSGVNGVDRFGDLCMNWTADYAIRLAHTLLTMLAQRPSTLSPPDSRAVARLLQAVRTSLSTKSLHGMLGQITFQMWNLFCMTQILCKFIPWLQMAEWCYNHPKGHSRPTVWDFHSWRSSRISKAASVLVLSRLEVPSS